MFQKQTSIEDRLFSAKVNYFKKVLLLSEARKLILDNSSKTTSSDSSSAVCPNQQFPYYAHKSQFSALTSCKPPSRCYRYEVTAIFNIINVIWDSFTVSLHSCFLWKSSWRWKINNFKFSNSWNISGKCFNCVTLLEYFKTRRIFSIWLQAKRWSSRYTYYLPCTTKTLKDEV